MAKTLAQARQKPSNIGDPVPAPAQPQNVPPVATTVPRELPGLGRATFGPTPSVWTTQYDSVKQFYRPGTSQQRFPPLPTKANPQINAQAASVTKTIIENTKAATGSGSASAFVPSLPVNPQSTAAYVVKKADLASLDTFSNNAGGTIVLPGASIPAGSFFSSTSSSGHSAAASVSGNAFFSGAVIAIQTAESDLGSPNLTPTGSGWTVIDAAQNGAFASVYAQLIPSGVFTANYSMGTTLSWASLLLFFANCNTVPKVVQLMDIASGGIAGTGMFSKTFPLPVTPGNAILVVQTVTSIVYDAVHNDWPFTIFSASDGVNPYSVVGSSTGGVAPPPPPGTGLQSWAALASNVVGGSTTITVDVTVPAGHANGGWSASAYEINLGTAKPIPSGFPAGWYCYLENTGLGTFSITSPALIDGSSSPVSMGPNTGTIVAFDGTNWFTERGLGGGASLTLPLSVLNGGTGTSTPGLLAGSGINISGPWPDQTISASGIAPPASNQSLWTWPQVAVSSSSYGAVNPISASSMNFTANQIKLFYVNIDKPIQVGNFSFQVTASDTHHYDWGMYNTSGTLVWNLGPQIFNSTGQITVPFVQGTITIQPGNYWLAFTGDGTGLTFQGVDNTAIANVMLFANSKLGNPAWWTSSTASTGGSLTGLTVTMPSTPTTAANLTSGIINNFSAQPVLPIICLST